MHSLNPENPPALVVNAPPRRDVWKFWGTTLWGVFAFAALFVGQVLVLVYDVMERGGTADIV